MISCNALKGTRVSVSLCNVLRSCRQPNWRLQPTVSGGLRPPSPSAEAERWAIELKARIDSIDRCSHIC